jgi:hypothetical protein
MKRKSVLMMTRIYQVAATFALGKHVNSRFPSRVGGIPEYRPRDLGQCGRGALVITAQV